MTNSDSWKSFPDDLAPMAPRTGPFAQRPFLETLWHHRADDNGTLHIESSPDGAAAVVLADGVVSLAGRSHLTDYHSPVGPNGADALVEALTHFPLTPFDLDSLPAEATAPIMDAFGAAGIDALVSERDATAVLPLPTSYDEWLAALGKKQRHEVRRKRRRFEEEFGAVAIRRHAGDAVDVFCDMHRLSAGEKGQFMTEPMVEFFTELVDSAGASIHLLTCDGVARAAAFGFETPDGYYYYNSAYDPAAAMASPGIVLFSTMIEAEIQRGATVFDFLKGDEPYKFRHGAQPRQLYAITGSTP